MRSSRRRCAAAAAVLWCIATGGAAAQAPPRTAFTISERDLVPEGIAYDPRTRSFFVSSTNLRKIVRIGRAGAAPPRDFVTAARDGIWGVVGMRVDTTRGVLWAITSHAGSGMPMDRMDLRDEGRSGLLAYDIATSRLLHRYLLATADGPHFLNDLVIDAHGRVYATDTRAGVVWVLDSLTGVLAPFADPGGTRRPNGIDLSPDAERLYVALDSAVGVIDLRSRRTSAIRFPAQLRPETIDGLYAYGNSLVAIQPGDTAGRAVVQYQLSADHTTVVRADVLVRNVPPVEQPSTGVIVGDDLYFVANSQLQRYAQLYARDHTTRRTDLDPIHILNVRLRERRAGGYGLVPLTGDSSVAIVDLAGWRQVGRIGVGAHPQDIVMGPDGLAFVLEMGSDAHPGHSIAVLNLRRRRVARRIDIAPYRRPHWAQLAADGGTLWVACAPDSAIIEVDLRGSRATRAWRTGRSGGWMFAVTPDARKLFVAQFDAGGVTVIDRTTGLERWVPLSGRPIGIAASPDGRDIWVGATGTDTIYVLSAAADTVVARFASRGHEPARIAFTPGGKRVLVTDSRSDSLTTYDAPTRRPLRGVFTGARTWPKGLALDGAGAIAYVSLMETGDVIAVDVQAGTSSRRLHVGTGPERMALWNDPVSGGSGTVPPR